MKKYFIVCVLIVCTCTTLNARTISVSWHPETNGKLAGCLFYESNMLGEYDSNNVLLTIPYGSNEIIIENLEFFVMVGFGFNGNVGQPSYAIMVETIPPSGIMISLSNY